MKVNIKKLEGGGFATFTPVIASTPNQGQSAKTSAQAAPASTSILDEATFKELLTKGGLVNDTNSLVSELAKMESGSQNPYTQSSNRSLSLRMIGKVNELRQSKELWKEAMMTSKSTGGIGELAVGGYGEVYSKDKDNKIITMSLSDYKSSEDKPKLLTVAELLNERQYNPNVTGRNDLFNAANNSIGLNKITTHINSVISAFGTETNETSNVYTKQQITQQLTALTGAKPTEEVKDAMQTLQSIANTPGELYKVSRTNSSERRQALKAVDYIWKTLGTNAQQKLTATSVLSGEDDPRKFILSMIGNQTNESQETDISPYKMPDSENADGSSKTKNISLSPQELFHNDRLYTPGMTYDINGKDGNTLLKVTSTGKEALMNLDNNTVITSSSMNRVLNEMGYNRILDKSNMYIGDTKINETLLSEIAFTGEDVGKVYLPVKNDGTPDFAKIANFNKVYEKFNDIKDSKSREELEQFFRSQGFSNVKIMQTASGDKVIAETGSVKPFLAMPIITNSASDISTLPWMLKSTGNNADNDELLMKQAFTTLSGTPSKPILKNTMPSSWKALETPYRGIMFIAYRPSSSAILSSMNKHVQGTASTELDINRNLRFSSNSVGPGGLSGNASLLMNNQ